MRDVWVNSIGGFGHVVFRLLALVPLGFFFSAVIKARQFALSLVPWRLHNGLQS